MSSSAGHIHQAVYAESTERRVPWVPIGVIITLVALAVLAPILSLHDPGAQNLRDARTPPFQTWEYPLGTDLVGKDILSRLIYGARPITIISGLALVGGVIVGMGLGSIVAFLARVYKRVYKWIDTIKTWNLYFMIAVSCLLSFAMNVLLGMGLTPIVISAAAFPALYVASLVGRGEISVRDKDFRRQTITLASLSVVGAVLIEALISGVFELGLSPGSSSWGIMISEGFFSSSDMWWLWLFPGATIAVIVALLYFFSLRNVLYLKDYHPWPDY